MSSDSCPEKAASGVRRRYNVTTMAVPDPDQINLFTGEPLRVPAPEDCDAPINQPHCVREVSDDGQAMMRMCVLGSGSAGNSSVISYQGNLILIDAGFGPRTTAARLAQRGLAFSQVKAICVTHLDRDHFSPALLPTLVKWGVKVYIHERHVDEFWHAHEWSETLHDEGLLRLFTSRRFSPLEGMTFDPIRLQHDKAGSYGFRVESPGGSIGYATDLGQAPEALIEHVAGVDLLAIESNYDMQMQLASPRPHYLKERIMGGFGHLSNEQCLEAVLRIFGRDSQMGPQQVILLHRSRDCNCPVKLRAMYERYTDISRLLHLSEQDMPSPWLTATRRPGE